MRCLEIPVDHRLRRWISTKCGSLGSGPSQHVHLLKLLGDDVKSQLPGGVPFGLAMDEIDFGLELARPETKGGIVILLYHPDPSQSYTSGYSAEEARCATLASVRELILCVTAGTLDSDAITILDSLPFLPEDFDERDDSHNMAHK